ncbi:MAG: hypothetical protein ACREJ6_12640 [Candidatus Methylomirabilis sp.]
MRGRRDCRGTLARFRYRAARLEAAVVGGTPDGHQHPLLVEHHDVPIAVKGGSHREGGLARGRPLDADRPFRAAS